jgi:hypothetical protein
LDLVLTLDRDAGPLEQGPDAHVRLAGNLVPGWAISLLALALLLPGGVAAVDALARVARRREGAGRSLVWAFSFAVPVVAGLAALYVLTLVGLMPDPGFPFDPGRFGIGPRAIVVAILIALAVAFSARATRPMRRGADLEPQALAASVGGLTFVAAIIVWLANPYLALLLVPLVHAWTPAARSTGSPSAVAMAVIAALAVVPVLAAQTEVAASLDSGPAAPWHGLLMVADGQIGFVVATSGSVLAGCVIALVAVGMHQGRLRRPVTTTGRQ